VVLVIDILLVVFLTPVILNRNRTDIGNLKVHPRVAGGRFDCRAAPVLGERDLRRRLPASMGMVIGAVSITR
jgi:hypothetical protein